MSKYLKDFYTNHNKMVKYSCETCQKVFTQKGHYNSHKNRKRPCKKDNTIVEQELLKRDIVTSTKTLKELIGVCKERGIKGYSGKRRQI